MVKVVALAIQTAKITYVILIRHVLIVLIENTVINVQTSAANGAVKENVTETAPAYLAQISSMEIAVSIGVQTLLVTVGHAT